MTSLGGFPTGMPLRSLSPASKKTQQKDKESLYVDVDDLKFIFGALCEPQKGEMVTTFWKEVR